MGSRYSSAPLARFGSAILLFAFPVIAPAAMLFNSADFQDFSTGGWTAGAPHPQPPSVVENSGPGGIGDHHLGVFSSGINGAGGRLATFSTAPEWTGDYLGAGITSLIADLRNTGGGTLNIRLGIDGPGGRYVTTAAVTLGSPSLWTAASFSLLPQDLSQIGVIGSGDPADTLAAVSQVRLLHNPNIDFKAIVAPGSLAIDNIAVIPEPTPSLSLLLAVPACLFFLRRREQTNSRPILSADHA